MTELLRSVQAVVWERRGFAGWAGWLALQPAAALFKVGVGLRDLAYRSGLLARQRAAIAVVSVGNLSVGGTGKTPMTLWLARQLRARGWRVGIVLRGYTGEAHGVVLVSRGEGVKVGVELVGDEAVMLAKGFDGVVVAARQRIVGVEAAAELGCDVAVLDDGFQHRALDRDFDLVLVGNRGGAALPAGPMREGWGALSRADAVALVHKLDGDAPPRERVPAEVRTFDVRFTAASLVEADGGLWRESPLRRLSGKRVALVSGIADPEPFYALVRQWEAEIVEVFEFADHHRYTIEDWQRINRDAREADLVVTTEKDLVKLEHFPFARGRLLALRIAAQVTAGEELIAMIENALPREAEKRS